MGKKKLLNALWQGAQSLLSILKPFMPQEVFSYNQQYFLTTSSVFLYYKIVFLIKNFISYNRISFLTTKNCISYYETYFHKERMKFPMVNEMNCQFACIFCLFLFFPLIFRNLLMLLYLRRSQHEEKVAFYDNIKAVKANKYYKRAKRREKLIEIQLYNLFVTLSSILTPFLFAFAVAFFCNRFRRESQGREMRLCGRRKLGKILILLRFFILYFFRETKGKISFKFNANCFFPLHFH